MSSSYTMQHKNYYEAHKNDNIELRKQKLKAYYEAHKAEILEKLRLKNIEKNKKMMEFLMSKSETPPDEILEQTLKDDIKNIKNRERYENGKMIKGGKIILTPQEKLDRRNARRRENYKAKKLIGKIEKSIELEPPKNSIEFPKNVKLTTKPLDKFKLHIFSVK